MHGTGTVRININLYRRAICTNALFAHMHLMISSCVSILLATFVYKSRRGNKLCGYYMHSAQHCSQEPQQY